jgi:hypothetical protein
MNTESDAEVQIPFWRRVADDLFDRQGLDAVFRHVSNLITAVMVVAAGLYAARHLGSHDLAGAWNGTILGYGIAALGIVLLALNFGDGLRRLLRLRHRALFSVVMVLLYAVLSVRLAQIVFYWRS